MDVNSSKQLGKIYISRLKFGNINGSSVIWYHKCRHRFKLAYGIRNSFITLARHLNIFAYATYETLVSLHTFNVEYSITNVFIKRNISKIIQSWTLCYAILYAALFSISAIVTFHYYDLTFSRRIFLSII